ncbi:ABC transporter permease [Myxococcota bacterium]
MLQVVDRDHWREIIDTMQSNRLRTFLTACGVFWGVFMLVAMLGFGNGLEAGVFRSMGGFATNAVYVWGHRTSKPYKGFQPGRLIHFKTADIEAIRVGVRDVQHVCPRNRIGGFRGGTNVTRGDKTGSFTISGDVPEIIEVQPVDILEGRFLNPFDEQDRRKIAVIGDSVRDELFVAGESVVGSHIEIRGSHFEVVGLFRPRQVGDHGDRLSNSVFVPFSTFQTAFNWGDEVGWFAVTAQPWASGSEVEAEVKALLAERYNVAPDDPNGIGSYNAEEDYQKMIALFTGITALTWFVGLMTLIAGVIGVSNIMLIAVKERTKEIGVRRAVGATPASIIGMIVQESIALTSVSGYGGLVLAVAVLELVGRVVGTDARYFAAPSVDLGVALMATVVLMVCGGLAGIMPARTALRINPVEALRAE